MINDKQRAELDQGLALILEFYPVQWRQMYVRLMEEGFNESQAMDLLKTYIRSTVCG